MQEAKPALLEPVMNVEIQAPVEYAGDLMGDLNGRRGRISGMETKGGTQFIRAQVPMAEMLNYQSDLTAMTQGRASFTMEFDHYDFVPQLQAEKIIAAAKAARRAKRKKRNRVPLKRFVTRLGRTDHRRTFIVRDAGRLATVRQTLPHPNRESLRSGITLSRRCTLNEVA